MVKKVQLKNAILLFMLNFGIGLANDTKNSQKDSYPNFIDNNYNLKCGIYDKLNLYSKAFFLPKTYIKPVESYEASFEAAFQHENDVEIKNSVVIEDNKNEKEKINLKDHILSESEVYLHEDLSNDSMPYKINNICTFYDINVIIQGEVNTCNFEDEYNDDYIENENIIGNIIDGDSIKTNESNELKNDYNNNNNDNNDNNISVNDESGKVIDLLSDNINKSEINVNEKNTPDNEKADNPKNINIDLNILNNTSNVNIQKGKNELVGKNTQNPIIALLSKYFSFDKKSKKEKTKEKITKEDEIKPIFPTKDFSLTGKERPNYASSDCAAILLKSNKEAKYANSILNEKKDSYMINECSAKNKFVVIELCNDILIDAIVIGNFELFSSTIKLFKVSLSNKFNYHNNKWTTLAYFQAVNSRDIQVFKVDNPVMYARYVRIDFISNYGFESFCPLNLLRIHGITMMEEYKADEYPDLIINKEDNDVKEDLKIIEEKSINEDNKQQINFHLDYLRLKYNHSKDEIDKNVSSAHSLDSLFKQYFGDSTNQINNLQESNESIINTETGNNSFNSQYHSTSGSNNIGVNNNNHNNGSNSHIQQQQPVQENIYKTIMRRLTTLENNSTASIIYLQEQNKMLDHYFSIIQRLQNLLPLESLTDENIGVASASAVENLQIYLEGEIKEMKTIYSKKIFDLSIEILRDKRLYMEKLNNAIERIESLETSRNYQLVGLIIIILFSSRVSQIINALHSLIFDSMPFSHKLKKNNNSKNKNKQLSEDLNDTLIYNNIPNTDERPLLEDVENYSMSGFSLLDEDEIENEIILRKSNRSSLNSTTINHLINIQSKRLSSSNKQEYVRLPKNQQGKSIPDINIYKNYNNYYNGDNNINYLNNLENNTQKRNSLTDLDLYVNHNHNNNSTNTETEDDRFFNKSGLSSSKLSLLTPLSNSSSSSNSNKNKKNKCKENKDLREDSDYLSISRKNSKEKITLKRFSSSTTLV
ncbi:hypothetical protein BCR36DRAFT_409078 [Piromyces finnis]|uniref:SUN domain-containing protein n=1 Tax=Piromyces finnis TaxID=1754191 RepID=A0A1Y1VLC7_9FUNG|nr:hypothetical protein BCR36DRAFT_409078 [Piromyces finnis]|eukprot:ORX58568.1 hypothetical protein BCR36DRAFT_409078 [Piromyces finnis]